MIPKQFYLNQFSHSVVTSSCPISHETAVDKKKNPEPIATVSMSRPFSIQNNKIIRLHFHCGIATTVNGYYGEVGFVDDGRKNIDQSPLKEALHLLYSLEEHLDPSTYASLLHTCIDHKSLIGNKLIHAHITQRGFMEDRFVLNTLINTYAKCGSVEDARRIFDQMPERNVFSWTMMIAAYAKLKQSNEALRLFSQMQRAGVQPDRFTFASILPACTSLATLKDIHEELCGLGFETDVFVGSALVDLYAKYQRIQDARHVFDKIPQRDLVCWNTMIAGYAQNGYVNEALKLFHEMPKRNVVSWTAMIAGYAQNGQDDEALKLFQQMQVMGTMPNVMTFASVISACANVKALELGKEIHEEIIRSGLQGDVFMGNALVDMYSKCGEIVNARHVFDKMPKQDVVSWNAIIGGYAQGGLVDDARMLFEKMPVRDVVSWTTMVTGYAYIGNLDEAWKFFLKMPEKNVVSWTAMISGYARIGHSQEAMDLYRQMQQAGVRPNMKTYSSVLSACANSAALEQGIQIHKEILGCGLSPDVFVESALVDMYAKCGNLEKAREVFDKIHQPVVASWNVMIAGYAMHGCGKEALKLFEQMQNSDTKPDPVTLLSVLSACCHAGLVDEGQHYFHCMSTLYHITPEMEHYGCMVDLLGRAGLLGEANDFINKMAIKPDATVWRSLLGACRTHINVDLGEYVAERLIELDPDNASPYVLLSNIYAAAGKWDSIKKMRKTMKGRKVEKQPGCSWINVDKNVYTFHVDAG